jgi:predicted HAD superfamily phosphohydrolase
MDDKILSELKSIGDSQERLRSIENLLERIVESNEQIVKQLERSWQAYVESTKPKQY